MDPEASPSPTSSATGGESSPSSDSFAKAPLKTRRQGLGFRVQGLGFRVQGASFIRAEMHSLLMKKSSDKRD